MRRRGRRKHYVPSVLDLCGESPTFQVEQRDGAEISAKLRSDVDTALTIHQFGPNEFEAKLSESDSGRIEIRIAWNDRVAYYRATVTR